MDTVQAFRTHCYDRRGAIIAIVPLLEEYNGGAVSIDALK
jgi:hypothetical protein